MLGFVAGFAFRAASSVLALVIGAADTACTESGYDFADGAVVLQTVINRAETGPMRGWKRYDGTLQNALWSPAQHAHGCPIPLAPEHVVLGVLFVLRTLPVPEWAKTTWYYCGDYDKPGACRARGGRVVVGTVRHVFWSP